MMGFLSERERLGIFARAFCVFCGGLGFFQSLKVGNELKAQTSWCVSGVRFLPAREALCDPVLRSHQGISGSVLDGDGMGSCAFPC